MKRILILMLTGLLVMSLSAGVAWAKTDNAKKEEAQTKVNAMQMYKTQYKSMVNHEISAKGNKFNDTANHWASASIQRMVDMELFAGYDDGTFKPNNNMSQAEMIALLMRLVDADNNDDEDENSVSDAIYSEKLNQIPGWARESVAKAVKLNIMNLNRFHSDQQASRAQTCVAFAKALHLDPINNVDVNFADNSLIEKDDLGYILAMYQAGYIKGAPGNYFLPENGITRAEMAVIMERILADYKADGSEEDEVDLSALESDLSGDYDEIKDVPVDSIKLEGGKDEVDVEVEVNLANYKDEWSDLGKSDIKDWLENLVGDIQDELSGDTIVSGKIINNDNDDTLVRFSKDGNDDLSLSYNGDDVKDVEDDLKGDEFDIVNIEFEITSISYNEDDKIKVDLEAQEDVSTSQWDDLNSSDVENEVEIICEEIAESFQDAAGAEPAMINIYLYDKDAHLLESYEYDVEDETLD
ncbi:S-layer homology domain-containing protein [Desulfotomaculum arcticum]|uniref:S-layer homology domain-containing protein n=1 Tax=Desulfotruncus arcticus DSM 17038 TaxID=1121424 RepID=A0A1I2TE20_9FIRM|nr:S-layer homology domain-containing protein [Desulfotruncus arcticus]SFG63142.1 S-layer homology domain-containing protein [Desulfotomaculum arcticum] [Desulfotruncus arcticus DSM 17038]